MKRIITRTTTAIVLAITMLLALIGGLLFIKNEGKSANAADVKPTVKIAASTTSFVASGSFKLTVTVDAPGVYLNTVGLYIGPKDMESATPGTTFSTSQMALLTMDEPTINPDLLGGGTRNMSVTPPAANQASGGMYNINLSNIHQNSTAVAADNCLIFSANITISESAAPGTTFVIGVFESTTNSVALKEATGSTKYTYTAAGAKVFDLVPLTFTITEPSNNAKLSEIKVGQGEETADNPYTTLGDDENGIDSSTTLNYIADDPTAPLTVKVASVDGVKSITLKPGDVVVEDGEGEVTIPANGVITIEVLAEDGKTKETYTINVKVVGASLTGLIAASDSTLAGVTTKDLQGTFASTTYDYDVIVPNDGNCEVTVTPTISTGNYASNTATLEKVGAATLSATSVTSGSSFTVSNVETGNKVTITVSADDGAGNTSEKVYTLTFKVVDTDTEFTMVVKGRNNPSKVFNNSEVKAAAENPAVDYYYAIVGETNGNCTVVITASSSASVKVNTNNYVAPGADLAEGTHTVTVTAEAGNSVTKKVKITNYVPLELANGIDADFIYEEVDNSLGAPMYYRRTYKEKGLTHGIDDLDFEKIIIGQVEYYTTISEFLENFKDSTKIKLYTDENECVWNCGVAGEDLEDEYLLDDADEMPVGTSWYVQYVVNNKVEETIYISVLGDLNGDGCVDSFDISAIGDKLRYLKTSNDYSLEARLAACIENWGDMTINDIGDIGEILKDWQYDITQWFYQAS